MRQLNEDASKCPLFQHNVFILTCFDLTDMTFDDDTKLFGLMRRYSDPEEAEELQRQVIEYVRTQIHDVNAEIQQFQTASATP